jgi:hypothetical protein
MEDGKLYIRDSRNYVAVPGSIQDRLDDLLAERDEARAKLASLVPGVVRIPEPTDEQYFGIFGATQVGRPWSKKEAMGRLLAWARTHAEVVVDARELESLRGAVKDALEILYEEGAIGVDNDCVESLCKATGRDYGEVMTGPPE